MAPTVIGKLDTFRKDSLDIEWRIENFHLLFGSFYASPAFSFADASWCLNIYPFGDSHSADVLGENISLYVFRKSVRGTIKLEYSLALETVDGEKYEVRHGTSIFSRRNRSFGWRNFLPREEIDEKRKELLISDALIVSCSMKISKSTEAKTSSADQCTSEVLSTEPGESCTSGSISTPSETKVLNDFKELFLKKEDCDVVINVQGKEFQAHRTILRARSPVLASTFRSNMKEKSTGVIEIEDCDPTSFSDFLCFLYCGEIKNLSTETVFSLFYTADKYDVKDLRAKCMDFLKENLCVDTFCETISLALRHSERELVELATDFFIKNAPNIILTVQWQTFLAENPTESNELLVKLLVPNTSNLGKLSWD